MRTHNYISAGQPEKDCAKQKWEGERTTCHSHSTNLPRSRMEKKGGLREKYCLCKTCEKNWTDQYQETSRRPSENVGNHYYLECSDNLLPRERPRKEAGCRMFREIYLLGPDERQQKQQKRKKKKKNKQTQTK